MSPTAAIRGVPPKLLERDEELGLLRAAVDAVSDGTPQVVLLEGPAGIGKTELLRAIANYATAAGLRVLTARADELEHELGLGIVRQLLEPPLFSAGDAERAALLKGPAAGAGALFGIDGAVPGQSADELSPEHALYWLCARLSERSPLVIAIDDIQWADASSLRWLAYLMRRLDELPVLVAMTRRTDHPPIAADILERLAAEPVVTTLRPKPLSARAVQELVRTQFGSRPEPRFVAACHEAAGGNPLFVLQLLDSARAAGLRPIDPHADALESLAPQRVSQIVLDRLRALPATAVKLAENTSVLGAAAEVRHAARLSDLDQADALEAADQLTAAGLMRPGHPLEFVNPIVRASVYESLPAGRRATEHRRAAELLREEDAPPAVIALHLLEVPPAGDSWAVEVLCAAAAAAVLPEVRAVYLRRAIAEPPPSAERANILLDLGRAESLVYDPRAIEHLAEVLRISDTPRAASIAAEQLSWSLVEHGRVAEAEPILNRSIDQLARSAPARGTPDHELLLSLHASLLDVRLETSRLSREQLADAIAMAGACSSEGERALLSVAAMVAPAVGIRSAEIQAMAARALQGWDIAALDGLRLVYPAVWALEFAGEIEQADDWFLRLQEEAQRRQSPLELMLASSARADVCCRRGALADAEQEAQAALELARAHGREYTAPISIAALTLSLTEQGKLEAAANATALVDGPAGALCDYSVYLYARGWLTLAQGSPSDAVATFLESGELMQHVGHDFPGFWPWRIGLALAHLASGNREESAELASSQLELVRAFGAPAETGIALRTLGLAEQGAAGLELLRAAVHELERSPATLELAKAQLELGATLRRSGKRTESREWLRRALDLADRCGAAPIADRAREELVIAGGRPRRTRIEGVEALTAGELRVARLAAGGSTNREIAQQLFVTAKAVEKHLASAYRKLSISGRRELAPALGAGD
jgi:DNA-binding CsgD family transcriptional regulator